MKQAREHREQMERCVAAPDFPKTQQEAHTPKWQREKNVNQW